MNRRVLEQLAACVLALAAASGTWACDDDGEGEVPIFDEEPDARGTAGELTDAEVAEIHLLFGEAAIARAEAASPRLKREDVRAFAESMRADHTAENAALDALLRELDLVRDESPLSQELADEQEDVASALAAADDEAIDKHYLDAEIAAHLRARDLLDDLLVSETEDPELRSFLASARAEVVDHLDRAQALKSAVAAPFGTP